jgi:hypothetical protein
MKLLLLSKILLLKLIFLGISGGALYSQVQYLPHPDSRLWIEGSSNVNQFECVAREYNGDAIIRREISGGVESFENDDQLSIRVEIHVKGFECGRSRMNRDLRNALKSNRFPKITFIFGNAVRSNSAPETNGSIRFEVSGVLTVAGNSQNVNV